MYFNIAYFFFFIYKLKSIYLQNSDKDSEEKMEEARENEKIEANGDRREKPS